MIISKRYTTYLDLDMENVEDYIEYLTHEKLSNPESELSWQAISDLVAAKFEVHHSRHWYARRAEFSAAYPEPSNDSEDAYRDKLLELQKLKVKISDERVQNNAYIRRLAREETIKEIALEAARSIGGKKLLPTYEKPVGVDDPHTRPKEATLLLSDWHLGIEISNPWNYYNPEVAKRRISSLITEVIRRCKKQDVNTINVLNLSDLIAGRIHLTIRLESRIDVITQIMEVSEILAECLNSLSQYFTVNYYSCNDNHSRLEPNKADSLDLESLCRITDWYLRQRLGDSIHFHDNEYGDDIISLNVLGHNIAAVHGHNDAPNNCIEKVSLITRQSYDLICMAHRHHFSMDERDQCRLICNGSLMGTDNYALKMRLHSKPSQTLFISTPDRVCDSIHIIELD